MSGLSDVERDACDVVHALAGLTALLGGPVGDGTDPTTEDARHALAGLAEGGAAAAVRVLDYLRALRGAGDGEAVAVPPRLGLWRDWVPPRGHVLGHTCAESRVGEVHRRRADPGE